jgi:hypothetical protein
MFFSAHGEAVPVTGSAGSLVSPVGALVVILFTVGVVLVRQVRRLV